METNPIEESENSILEQNKIMDSKPPDSAIYEQSYKLEQTSGGKPYILLKTSSSTPIYLTEFYPTDTTAVQATVSIPSVSHNLISILQPYTFADAEWWVNLQLGGKSSLPLQVLRSGHPESGTFIGSVSLMPADSEAFLAIKDKIALKTEGPGENECELGYYLHPDWRGKGIMRNAVRALIWWAGKANGVTNVVVKALEGNLGSRGVIESLKEFVREEEKDDWVDWPEVKGGGRRKIFVWRWV
jgi:RimJ/RimL family protein N-acetyltransferase